MTKAKIDRAMESAVAHHRAGRLAETEKLCRQVLKQNPNHADALHLLGTLAIHARRPDAAVQFLRRSIAINPNSATAFGNLGKALFDSGQIDAAITAWRESTHLKPDFADGWLNLGIALQHTGQIEEAIRACRQAVKLRPNSANAYLTLGHALKTANQIPEAIDAHQQAIRLKPDFAEAHSNLGVVLMQELRIDKALAAYAESLRLKPDYAEAHFNLSLALLLKGDFAQGWQEHEWRMWRQKLASTWRDVPEMRWDGSELNGRTILLHAEQGYGDTIQFVRYAPMVANRGGKVILQCRPALNKLFASFPGVERVIGDDQPLPKFDLHCSLLSLPHVFQTTIETIPATVPYLKADSELSAQWAKRLATGSQRRIGIAWAGRATYANDRTRSIPLATLRPLFNIPGVKFYSLQKAEGAAHPDHPELIDHTAELHDFAYTAALIANLDLVISVDTAVAHLAGAMAKPVWVLLPFSPDWRWLLDRDDSPWYPTMRLFRQKKAGDWAEVIARIAEALR